MEIMYKLSVDESDVWCFLINIMLLLPLTLIALITKKKKQL